MELLAQQRIGTAAEEVGIFEQPEDREVQCDTKDRDPLRTPGTEPPCDQPVGDGQTRQQRDETHVPPAVESQRCHHDHGLPRRTMRGECVVKHQNDRQEADNEDLGIK